MGNSNDDCNTYSSTRDYSPQVFAVSVTNNACGEVHFKLETDRMRRSISPKSGREDEKKRIRNEIIAKSARHWVLYLTGASGNIESHV